MRTIGVFSSIILVIFLSVNCSEEKVPNRSIIPQEKFVLLYVDILMAGESGNLSGVDSSVTPPRPAVLDSLYGAYGVTEAQVKETIDEYSKDLRLWKEFYDQVVARLEIMQREEQTNKQS